MVLFGKTVLILLRQIYNLYPPSTPVLTTLHPPPPGGGGNWIDPGHVSAAAPAAGGVVRAWHEYKIAKLLGRGLSTNVPLGATDNMVDHGGHPVNEWLLLTHDFLILVHCQGRVGPFSSSLFEACFTLMQIQV